VASLAVLNSTELVSYYSIYKPIYIYSTDMYEVSVCTYAYIYIWNLVKARLTEFWGPYSPEEVMVASEAERG
jgi:hypothetical protein